jgi:short-subunit dehydrogenase
MKDVVFVAVDVVLFGISQSMLPIAIRKTIAAAAVACTASFFTMDCNPTLFLADWYFRRNPFHSKHPLRIRQRRVWIIGASSGIGRELALQLAESTTSNNIDLILSSRSKDKLETVAEQCRQTNPSCKVQILPLDVLQYEELERAVQNVQNVDTVILNAGAGHLSPALETSRQTAESIFQLNALWPMVITPLLFQRNVFAPSHRPQLVVTSSVAGVLPVALSSTYAAAKHALHGYFRSLSAERPDILIHTVMPGPVDTDFFKNRGTSNHPDAKHPTVETTEAGSVSEKRSNLEMSVQRCAQLILTTMQFTESTEVWIAQQPVLTALYLQQLAPGFTQKVLHNRIGPRRVEIWRQGLDLYDPSSWTQKSVK